MKYVFLATLLVLAGCEQSIPQNKAKLTPSTIQYDVGLTSSTSVVEFQLSDGTRCVAVDIHGTSITCEWRQPVVLVPRVE